MTNCPSVEDNIFERLARMSVINGLLAIRTYRRRHPKIGPLEIAASLKRVAYMYATYDYEGALQLDALLPNEELLETQELIRLSLEVLARSTRPAWISKITLGREAIKGNLSAGQYQCFEAAGLFSSNPSPEVVLWWDRLASEVRADKGQFLVAKGREGERLSFSFERERAKQLGLDREVRWIALDDQTTGYDIWSYNADLSARLVEAKACSTYPLRFFVTKNEWQTACGSLAEYVFQIWHLPSETCHELTPDQLEPHIPCDRGDGQWESVQIVLNAN